MKRVKRTLPDDCYCEHNYLLLGCPFEDCDTSKDYLKDLNKQVDEYFKSLDFKKQINYKPKKFSYHNFDVKLSKTYTIYTPVVYTISDISYTINSPVFIPEQINQKE